jgi:hypothetical protein
VAFAPDGSLVAVCSHGINDITLWDGKSGAKKGSILVGFDRDKKVAVADHVTSNLIFAPDGTVLRWDIAKVNGNPSRENRP